MASVFSKIISGEIPSYKIAENEHFYAFLDINPVTKGHTLVIPKEEVDYILDIEDGVYADFFLFAKKVARAIEGAYPCKKVGMTVVGLEVPHAHIHLIPLQSEADMQFKNKQSYTPKEMQEIAQTIRSTFEKLH